jgi:glycosyltransferase involved in cell wall biosynthesis
MKILLGITKSNFGGAQRYVFDLATELKKSGNEVSVICGGHGLLIEKLKHEKIYPVSLPSLTRDVSILDDIKSFFTLLAYLHKHKPEVFHINSSKMGAIGALTGRIIGIKKIIYTVHGLAFKEKRPWLQKKIIKFIYWITIKLAHKTIYVAESLRSDLYLPSIENKIVVIHNGIQSWELTEKEEARNKLSPESLPQTVIVGAFSELHKIKGLDILIKAWAKFIIGRNAKLVLAGEGGKKENLEKLIKDLELENSVKLIGYVDNAKKYFLGLDIFILPSRSEVMPYSLLEAGLSGRSVIATNVGGIKEVITDKENGVLIDPENEDAIINSLITLYDNPVDRKELGERLKNHIKTNFSLDKMARETIKTYLS